MEPGEGIERRDGKEEYVNKREGPAVRGTAGREYEKV